MIRTIVKEIQVNVCDFCGKEGGTMWNCFSCGRASCLKCHEDSFVTYSFGVFVEGWADGYYCKPCDERLYDDESDALHEAYIEIRSLKEEHQSFSVSFNRRAEAAQAEAEKLFKARRNKERGL